MTTNSPGSAREMAHNQKYKQQLPWGSVQIVSTFFLPSWVQGRKD